MSILFASSFLAASASLPASYSSYILIYLCILSSSSYSFCNLIVCWILDSSACSSLASISLWYLTSSSTAAAWVALRSLSLWILYYSAFYLLALSYSALLALASISCFYLIFNSYFSSSAFWAIRSCSICCLSGSYINCPFCLSLLDSSYSLISASLASLASFSCLILKISICCWFLISASISCWTLNSSASSLSLCASSSADLRSLSYSWSFYLSSSASF